MLNTSWYVKHLRSVKLQQDFPQLIMSPPASLHSTTDKPLGEKAEQNQTAVDHGDEEKNFKPKSLAFWTIIAGVYLAIFLVALVSCLWRLPHPSIQLISWQDRMIIATAIPRITDEFHSIQDIGWYGSAYMLTAACFFPISGRVYQLYPTKWVFLTTIVIFEVGSVICGAAPNSIAFIIGRAIAGLGSAGVFTGGMMIIVPLVPLRKRPIFNSMFGLAFGLSSVLGPVVGGTLTDNV